jgi:hypothetical protein
MHAINGVVVSDPNRTFTAKEWEALGPNNGLDTVLQLREWANTQGGQNGRGCRCYGTRAGCNVSAIDTTENVNNEDTAIMDNTQLNDHGGRDGCGFGHGEYSQS